MIIGEKMLEQKSIYRLFNVFLAISLLLTVVSMVLLTKRCLK